MTKSTVRPIRTQKEYDAAVRRLSALIEMDPEPGSAEDDELELLQMVIGKYDEQNVQPWPLSPIEAIEFRMAQEGLSKKDLVPFIGSLPRVSEVMSGKRELTLPMIRKLSERLGIPAKSLIGSDAVREEEELDYARLPLVELQDRDCFGPGRLARNELLARAPELMFPLLQRARHASTLALLRAPLAQRGTRSMDEYGLFAWQLLAIDKARSTKTRGAFKPCSITPDWLRSVAKLSVFDEGPKLAQEHLSRHGICLVFIKHFAKTYLDGAAMLDGKTPIVALTLRHDRADNFWFALLHELAHVGWHLKENQFIADNLEDKTRQGQAEEQEADDIAQEALIPQRLWQSSAVKDTYSVDDALKLAEEAEVNPAIVAGRVRHATGNWRLLSGLISAAGPVSRHFVDQIG